MARFHLVLPPSLSGLLWSVLVFIRSSHLNSQLCQDENLSLSFSILIPHTDNSSTLSTQIIELLSCLHVSLEASYIDPSSVHPDASSTPKSSAFDGLSSHGPPPPLSQTSFVNLPPRTPNPLPQSSHSDLPYLTAEGRIMVKLDWEESKEEDGSSFTLLWNNNTSSWLAVYRFQLLVCQRAFFNFYVLLMLAN